MSYSIILLLKLQSCSLIDNRRSNSRGLLQPTKKRPLNQKALYFGGSFIFKPPRQHYLFQRGQSRMKYYQWNIVSQKSEVFLVWLLTESTPTPIQCDEFDRRLQTSTKHYRYGRINLLVWRIKKLVLHINLPIHLLTLWVAKSDMSLLHCKKIPFDFINNRENLTCFSIV